MSMSTNAQHENNDDVDDEARGEDAESDGGSVSVQTYDTIESKPNHAP